MQQLLESLLLLLTALGDLIVALAAMAIPFLPLAVWIVFWLFGVNWVALRRVLSQGGWIGLLLLGAVAILVWGTVAPPVSGMHHFLGLTLGNFVGKTVLVTALVCIMLLCGSVQLSGACGRLCQFEEPAPAMGFHGSAEHGDAAEQNHAAHGHGGHEPAHH